MRKVSIWISIVIIAISCYVLFATMSFPGESSGAPGPGFFPRILAVIIIGLSIGNLVSENGRNRDSDEPVFRNNFGKVVICAVILFAYLLLMNLISYVYITPSAIAAMMLDFDCRKPLPIILTSIGTTVFIYLIFGVVLGVRLPMGSII